MPCPRFEPLSLRFCFDSCIHCHIPRFDRKFPDFDPTNFNGRILLVDRDNVHLLYYGKTGEYVRVDTNGVHIIFDEIMGDYVRVDTNDDLLQQDSENHKKQKGECVRVDTNDDPMQQDSEDRKKQTGEYVCVDTNDPLQQDSEDPKKQTNKRQWLEMFPKTSSAQYNLLMTGPKYAVDLRSGLALMIQMEDLKEFDNSGDYADFLTQRYFPTMIIPCAVSKFRHYNVFGKCNEKIYLTVSCSTGSVILEGMVYWNSMAVRVEVRPQGIDHRSVDICGKITLLGGDVENPEITSLLFFSKETKVVDPGQTLPLLREKVAVDVNSTFTVKVDLCVCGHNVKFDAAFTAEDYADFEQKSSITCKKEKSGEYGKIEVIATGAVFE